VRGSFIAVLSLAVTDRETGRAPANGEGELSVKREIQRANEDAKNLRGRAEECRALADIAWDGQARAGYLYAAER